MSVQWNLGQPGPDIAQALYGGMDHGRQVRQIQDRTNALRGYAANPNDPGAQNALLVADPQLAGQMEDQRLQRSHAEHQAAIEALGQHRDRIIMGAQFLQGVTDEAGYQRALALARQNGIQIDDVPQHFDPQYVQGLLQVAQHLQAPSLDQGVHWQNVGPGGAFATDAQGRPIPTGDPRLGGQPAPQAPSVPAQQPGQPAPSQTAANAPNPAVSALYSEFRNLGWTDEGARTMVAQIGRENGYNPSLMFGTHSDPNNSATNAGIVSWQGDRRPAFMQFMSDHGFVQNGQIVQSEEALRAQAQFADQEMRQRYPESAAAVRDPNANYQSIEPVLSNNYFGWDRAGHHIDAQQHLARMGELYQSTAGIGGPQQPNPMQTASAGPVPPMGRPSLQDQARTGVIQPPPAMPPGFESDGAGGMRPMRGSQAEWERQHTGVTDARQQSNINTDNARQQTQMVNQVLQQFRSDPGVQAWRQARVSALQMRSLGQSGTATDDMGMIFSFMKVLDPGSTVREGEFANAQNTAGVPDRIRNYYNQLISGNRLNPTQRAQMVQTAGRLYTDRSRSYNEQVQSYRDQALEMGIPPERVGRMFPMAVAPRAADAARSMSGHTTQGASGHTSQGVRWRVVQ